MLLLRVCKWFNPAIDCESMLHHPHQSVYARAAWGNSSPICQALCHLAAAL